MLKIEDYAMTSAERDVLRQLFKNGPTWDGNIASKVGRSDLVGKGMVQRYEGYNMLSYDGLVACIDAGFRKD